MKKIIAVIAALTMAAASLTACQKSGESTAKTAKVIDIDLTNEEYAFGVDKDQPELLEKVNAFIKEIKDNGKFDEICSHYFGDGEPVGVESAAYDASKDQLVVATNAHLSRSSIRLVTSMPELIWRLPERLQSTSVLSLLYRTWTSTRYVSQSVSTSVMSPWQVLRLSLTEKSMSHSQTHTTALSSSL